MGDPALWAADALGDGMVPGNFREPEIFRRLCPVRKTEGRKRPMVCWQKAEI